MITDQDIEKLKETFATQESLDALSVKVDGIQEELGDLKVEFAEFGERLDSMDRKFDSLDVKFDAMLGLFTDTMQENQAGAVQYARHDRQIHVLASATGVTLPE